MKFARVDKHLIDIYLNSTNEGVFLLDNNKKITYCNSRYLEITGYLESDIVGNTPSSVLNGWHDEIFYSRLWSVLERNNFWENEVWDNHKTNNTLYVVNQRIIKYRDGFKAKYIGIISNITSELKATQELQFLERVDQSTNISNRFYGEKKLKEFINDKCKNIAVVILSINNVSVISETFGHKLGDSVLKEIAFRLKDCIHSENLFSFGLERFVLFLSYSDILNVEQKAFELIGAFHEPFNVKGNDFFLSVNLGVSLFGTDGMSTEELIRNADSAMHESQKEDVNTFAFYEPKMNESVLEQFQLVSDLRKSIERNELSMVYQPQIDSLTKKVIGAEALIRWYNKSRGNISPNIFIPIAEKKGLINPVGEWVLRNTCDEFINWSKNGIKNTSMAINISGVQFNDKRLLPLIKNIFYDKVDTSLIELEITESSFVHDIDLAIKTMHCLKDMGFKLAIDDFGTGFSSLSYLKKFPIDKLKIDKSFIANILTEPGNVAIVKSIITLASNLDLDVIAEGIETENQKNFVKKLGCNFIQGFYYSKPLTGPNFIDFYNGTNN